MAHHDDTSVRHRASNGFEMADHPCLKLAHALPAGRPALAASRVPPLPARIAVERRDWPSGPIAEIDLVERGFDGHPHAAAAADRGRRLPRPLARTRLNHVDVLADQTGGQSLGLPGAFLVEPHARHAADKDPTDAAMRRMPYEKERGRHGRTRLHRSPRTNPIVRSRASASVNCCGGDFMK